MLMMGGGVARVSMRGVFPRRCPAGPARRR